MDETAETDETDRPDEPAAGRTWRPAYPVDVRAILGAFRQGAGDPGFRSEPDGTIWRASNTPQGAGTLVVRADAAGGVVVGRAWGPGADWLLEGMPELLGSRDDDSGFVAHHEVVARLKRAFPGWRVPRSRCVVDILVPTVIAQKVTGAEAFAGYRRLARRFGSPAPGPVPAGLTVPPTARAWAAIPSWEWLRAGVDAARSDTVMRAMRVAGRLEECATLTHQSASARLCAVPGIGVWTAAEVAQRALGDPNSPSFGDYHLAKNLGWALVGRRLDDGALAEVLAPYAGHRYRVQRLAELGGLTAPRHGPRRSVPTHLPR